MDRIEDVLLLGWRREGKMLKRVQHDREKSERVWCRFTAGAIRSLQDDKERGRQVSGSSYTNTHGFLLRRNDK